MSSPLAIPLTAVKVAERVPRRKEIHFQNTGESPIYFKKQIPGAAVSVPSPTNYDFVLRPETKKESDPEGISSIFIETTASFYAVATDKPGVLAVMETVYVGV